MNIGSIIKYHRRLNSITQADLSRGICSISHLSKIENNSKEVDDQTIDLLLQRLNLNLKEIQESYISLKKLLDQFMQAMVYYDRNQASLLKEELEENETLISCTELIYIYHIYIYKYYLFISDIEKAQEEKNFLQQFHQVFSQHERDLFQYMDALLYLYKGEHLTALEILLNFEVDHTLPISLQGELYYQISLNYSYIENSGKCVSYAQKAFQEYIKSCNYIRIIHTQLLLSIHSTELKLYSDAKQHFEHMLRNTPLIGESHLIPVIHHNYAILHTHMNNYDEALEHYDISLKKAHSSDQYYITLSNYTEVLLKLNRREEALNLIKEIITNTKNKNLLKYHLIFKYHQLLLQDKEDRAIEYLETKVLPYLQSNGHVKDLQKYQTRLAEYYSDINPEKAVYYYQRQA